MTKKMQRLLDDIEVSWKTYRSSVDTSRRWLTKYGATADPDARAKVGAKLKQSDVAQKRAREHFEALLAELRGGK